MKRITARHRLAVLVTAAIVTVVGSIWYVASANPEPNAPAWVGDRAGCRPVPMAHVHNPQRLQLISDCATVTGQVKSVHLVSAFDDLKITLIPADSARQYLTDRNHGEVVADVIATDLTAVHAPAVGTSVTVWGAWVQDKATKAVEMLPAYRVAPASQADAKGPVIGQSQEKHGPDPQRQLKVNVTAPPSVQVGGEIVVTIKATWQLPRGRTTPASEVRLFTEMTSGTNGAGVRWKATQTDIRGGAVFRLVAIQVPGDYTLTVYAAPSGNDLTVTAPIHVSKT